MTEHERHEEEDGRPLKARDIVRITMAWFGIAIAFLVVSVVFVAFNRWYDAPGSSDDYDDGSHNIEELRRCVEGGGSVDSDDRAPGGWWCVPTP